MDHTKQMFQALTPQDKHELAACVIQDLCFWETPFLRSQGMERQSLPSDKRRNQEGRTGGRHNGSESDGSSSGPPDAWKSAVDQTTGRVYYYNAITRKTQWEKPSDLRSLERKRRREFIRKQKAFFEIMERNILESLQRRELIPSVPLSKTEKEGPPLEPIPLRVRTISGMNEHLLAELRDDSDNSQRSPRGPALEGRPPLPQRRTSGATGPLREEPPRRVSASRIDPREVAAEMKSHALRGVRLLDEPILKDAPLPSIIKFDAAASSKSSIPRPSALTIHKRRNTGGTIFVKSTMENPDISATIKCVCGVFRAHVVNSLQSKLPQLPKHLQSVDLDIFRDEFARRQRSTVPSLSEIESFYQKFYERSQMEQDTIIVSLIYAERLIKETNGALTPTVDTWAPILFSCMILASKVWDDLSMWNVDFSHVSFSSGMPPFSLKRINQMEFALLSCLSFNVKVPASEYAKYYFLIRTMLTRSGLLEYASAPLNKQEAKKLEHKRTGQYPEASLDNDRKDRNRSRSWDMECQEPSDSVGRIIKDAVCLEQFVSMKR